MTNSDEWADLRAWLAELGGAPADNEPEDAIALPLFRLVESEHLEQRLGEDRFLALIEKAQEEVQEKRQRIAAMMRYAGKRWDAPKTLEDALKLEAEGPSLDEE